MPTLGFLYETPVCIYDEFREGNVPPAYGQKEFYLECKRRMPVGKRIRNYRADSASYQAPNPDIERRLASNREDLETFPGRRVLPCLSRLLIPMRLNQRPIRFCNSLSLGTDYPLVLSLSSVFVSVFHPSGHKLSSKEFRLIPLNNSSFSRSIMSFRTVLPACFTIRPATCNIFQRNVAMVCFAHDSGHESRLNPIKRL